MSDDPLTECEECGAPVERVFHPIAVHYKGSGFYTTDYAKKAAGKSGGSSENKESSSGDGGADSKGSDSKKSEKKSESKGSGSSTDD